MEERLRVRRGNDRGWRNTLEKEECFVTVPRGQAIRGSGYPHEHMKDKTLSRSFDKKKWRKWQQKSIDGKKKESIRLHSPYSISPSLRGYISHDLLNATSPLI